jgi:hypothetical protein
MRFRSAVISSLAARRGVAEGSTLQWTRCMFACSGSREAQVAPEWGLPNVNMFGVGVGCFGYDGAEPNWGAVLSNAA